MRIVSLKSEGGTRLGILRGDALIDLGLAAPSAPRSLLSVLRGEAGGLATLESIAKAAPTSAYRDAGSIELAPPLANPGKIVCLGLNYADHATEGGHARPSYPSLFLRCNSSLVGHGDPILRPASSEQLDYEAELVAIVGRRARHVKAGAALDYLVGYSCFNDATIRDYQRKTAQWTMGKNFDSTGAFGPAFVTADELPPAVRTFESPPGSTVKSCRMRIRATCSSRSRRPSNC